MSKKEYENDSLIDDVVDEIVSGEKTEVDTRVEESSIPEDQEELYGKFNKRVPVDIGEVENGSTPIGSAPIVIPEPTIEQPKKEDDKPSEQPAPTENPAPQSSQEHPTMEMAHPTMEMEYPEEIPVDEDKMKEEFNTSYNVYVSVDGLGQLSVPKTMTFYEIYKEFVTHRFHFVGLTSEKDYKHIEEYLKNNKIKYLNIVVSDLAIKQFLIKLKTNTDYVIKRKLKN